MSVDDGGCAIVLRFLVLVPIVQSASTHLPIFTKDKLRWPLVSTVTLPIFFLHFKSYAHMSIKTILMLCGWVYGPVVRRTFINAPRLCRLTLCQFLVEFPWQLHISTASHIGSFSHVDNKTLMGAQWILVACIRFIKLKLFSNRQDNS